MRFMPSIMILVFAASPVFAVDFRWTLGFNQGTLEAIIVNGNNSSFNIYCPTGWDGEQKRPGMSIDVTGISEEDRVQIIVDGRNYPFLAKPDFQPYSRADWGDFEALVDALASSKRKSFVIEFPKQKKAETFSLLGARRVLRHGKDLMIAGCSRDEVEDPSKQPPPLPEPECGPGTSNVFCPPR